jgi:hypothetical protein
MIGEDHNAGGHSKTPAQRGKKELRFPSHSDRDIVGLRERDSIEVTYDEKLFNHTPFKF